MPSSPPSSSTMRPMFARLGLITRADGSAQLSAGETTVVSGVHGPCEVRPHLERTDRAAVEVVYRPKTGPARVSDRAIEAALRGVLEAALLTTAHPRTAVHVSVQQMHDGGGELACCINAACLAAVDASLPMHALFAAVTVAVDSDSGAVVVDPTAKQESAAAACLTATFDSVDRNVLSTHLVGKCGERTFQECVGAAREASSTVFDFYRAAIKRKFSKELSQQ